MECNAIESRREDPAVHPQRSRIPRGSGRARELRFGALGLAVLLALTTPLLGCGGKDEPSKGRPTTSAGEPALLDGALQPLREDFEAAYGKYRLVVVLSSSCSHCMEHLQNLVSGGLDTLLQDGVEVFYVWTAILPSDTTARARKATAEAFLPGVRAYYDPSARVSRAFGRMLQMGTGVDAYDIFLLYGPDATWDPDGTMEDEPDDFNVARALWAPQPAELMLGDPERLRIDIQTFWVKDLLEGYQRLKAESAR